MSKTVQMGEENLVVNSVKSCRKSQQKKNRNVAIVQSGENIIYNTNNRNVVIVQSGENIIYNTNKTVSVLCPAW